MAATIHLRSARIPIHRIRLEGFGKPTPVGSSPAPLPAVELESTPVGHVKVKIGTEEATIPGDILLKAVATLTKKE